MNFVRCDKFSLTFAGFWTENAPLSGTRLRTSNPCDDKERIGACGKLRKIYYEIQGGRMGSTSGIIHPQVCSSLKED